MTFLFCFFHLRFRDGPMGLARATRAVHLVTCASHARKLCAELLAGAQA